MVSGMGEEGGEKSVLEEMIQSGNYVCGYLRPSTHRQLFVSGAFAPAFIVSGEDVFGFLFWLVPETGVAGVSAAVVWGVDVECGCDKGHELEFHI